MQGFVPLSVLPSSICQCYPRPLPFQGHKLAAKVPEITYRYYNFQEKEDSFPEYLFLKARKPSQ
jgi:hypothetical protein